MKTDKLLELKLPKKLMVLLIERYQNTQCITVIWYFHGKREVVVVVVVGWGARYQAGGHNAIYCYFKKN